MQQKVFQLIRILYVDMYLGILDFMYIREAEKKVLFLVD